MAMNKPLMQLNEADVQVNLNSYIAGNGLAWRTLFPLRYTRKFDLKGIEGDEGIPVSADRVAFNAKAPIKTRKQVGTWNGKLGKISVSREKNEIEVNEYQDALILANASGDAAEARELVNMVYDDYDFVNKAMDCRIELDSLRIATSGKHTFNAAYDGDMATADEINFNIPAANFKGVTTAWSNAATANGLDDIINAQEAVAMTGAPRPMVCYMNKVAFSLLSKQASTAARLYPLAKANTLATITPEQTNLGAINSFMDENGYPHIYVIDSYVSVEAKDGEQTTVKPWADNVVTLSATKQLGWTYWKGVPNVDGTATIQNHAEYYKTTRYSDVNPVKEVTLGEAYVQCGLINRKSMVLLDVKNSSWNHGE